MSKRKWVRQPLVQVHGKVVTHGFHKPIAGVWHTTEGHDHPGVKDLEGVINFWKNQGRGFGAHIIIDKDGNSAVCAPFNRTCYHIGGYNTGRIGIELIGFAKFSPKIWWLRLKQLNKLAKWIAWINKEYGIPIVLSTSRGWAGHRDYPSQTHWDPGPFFPKKYVIRKAKQFRENGWT